MNHANILIVDDVPENLRLLTAILKESGHHVRPAASGKIALQAAAHSLPDLILLDIKMPEMDGLEVCAQLKAVPALQDIPVIFISALHETEDKLKAFHAGGVDYVTKPFQAEEVQARVHTHLELRRQKIQLQENLLKLQKLEELRDNLTHMIVHDMRSPLMSLDGYLDMLQMFDQECLSAKAKEYVAHARTNANRVIHMADEMLTVSKLEEGNIELQLVACDLAEMLREVVGNYEIVRGRKSIQYILRPGHFTVSVDRNLIGRVLQNLMDNAMKFSPDDGVIKVAVADQDKLVRVEVSDQGIGIPRNQQDLIFEKFKQLERQSGRSGVGLGLAFCKLAVEAHGGHIGVESETGKGSTFWFTLQRDRVGKTFSSRSLNGRPAAG